MADKKDQMRKMRDQGMKYRDIAAKFGVSYQYVAQVCRQYEPEKYRPVSVSCVYPNLRKWMCDNKVGCGELLRRMSLEYHGNNLSRLYRLLNGSYQPRKGYIDKLLQVTGMTYEVMFYQPEGCKC